MRHKVPHFTSKPPLPAPLRGGAGGGVSSYNESLKKWGCGA